MRRPWLIVLLALAALGGYAAGTTPVRAQGDVLPFPIGEVVTFTFQDKGTRQCRIAEVRGSFARCDTVTDRLGPSISRPEQPEEWVNVAQVEWVTRSRARR
jgi:hypothetical protein